MHLGQSLLLHGLDDLDHLSVGLDDLLELLDDGLGDLMDEDMGLVVGGSSLVTAAAVLMLLLDVQRRRLGLEGHVHWEDTAGNLDVSGALLAMGWGVDHFDVVLGMDGQFDGMAATITTSATAITTAITGSGGHTQQNGEDEKLWE